MENAKNRIKDLVERFRRNIDVYKNGKYNETQVRREFIDPFFEALGWDVANRSGYAEQYKDVVHEDSVKVGISLKAPDYSFRIGGQRKFFLEAKKPSVNIKTDISPAFQLRRYGWSAKLPLSIVTDFEELAVYDCRQKPNANDKVSTGRIAYYTYDQYIDRFEELWGTFSKDAVLKGSFDRYAVSSKGKRGTGEVDKEFLKEIETWRDALARNLAIRNGELTVHELNFAVQHTIDRIIFLRICEDRGIENYGRLASLTNGANVYPRLLQIFTEADARYNSGLFDFKADTLSHALNIDDKVLKGIIENLYYPKSPYEFSVLGAEILGNVYEQFLGKVIRLTSGHQAKVEEKPEVKKAGGVYYTPQYIVEYIVKNTVGKLLDGNPPQSPFTKGGGLESPPLKKGGKGGFKSLTPKQAAKLRILDPACGSGSFLIGAYQYLLDWHLMWYSENDPERHAKGKEPAIYKGAGNEWKLTTKEKKRILLNNIYGVDIDRQAVEVTKLSLLLKVLEDENQETIGKTLSLFKERVLPNLEENIKCGNSLIGPDFYDQQTLFPTLKGINTLEKGTHPGIKGKGGFEPASLGDDDMRRINVFDWEKEFPQIFPSPSTGEGQGGGGPSTNSGQGFDAVIGNPPYVRQEMLGEFKPYLQSHYTTYHGTADLYVYFIEKAVTFLKEGGHFSYIVANKWMRANYGEPLRRWMKGQLIEEISDFGDLPVFQTATTYPCIISIGKGKGLDKFPATKVETLDFTSLQEYVNENRFDVSRQNLDDGGWSLASEEEEKILAKLKAAGVPLGEYVHGKIYRGVLTGLNAAFVIDAETRDRLIAEDPKSAELIKPFLAGKDVKRYTVNDEKRFLIFTRRGINIKLYPAVENYLFQFKERLLPKPKDWNGDKWKGRKTGSYQWYEIQDAVDYFKEFDKPKIMWPEIAGSARFAFDEEGFYTNNKVFIIPDGSLYLLGLLNSSLLKLFIHSVCTDLQGNSYNFSGVFLNKTPIRTIDFNNPAEKEKHDRMVALVEQMLDLNKKLQSAKIAQDKELLERQIKITDNQIDQMVYDLYGLTEEDVKVVEVN